MKSRYKIPWHIRQFVKKELMDYKKNQKLLSKLSRKSGINTREVALISLRLSQIEKVFDSLSEEDKEAAEIIFYSQYTQVGAEIAKGISKAAYYNTMNKVIYLVAVEMDLL